MSDLVERLRSRQASWYGPEMVEAADEIEQLRADKAELLAALQSIANDDYLPDGIRAVEIARAVLAKAELALKTAEL